jgi:hypothetical protein
VAYFQELLPQFQGSKYEAAAAALACLPAAAAAADACFLDASGPVVAVGNPHALQAATDAATGEATVAAEGGQAAPMAAVRALLGLLKPWKKGPLNIFGVSIDTEWRCDKSPPHIFLRIHARGLRLLVFVSSFTQSCVVCANRGATIFRFQVPFALACALVGVLRLLLSRALSRSDWKWDRVQPHLGVSLTGKAVLDVG